MQNRIGNYFCTCFTQKNLIIFKCLQLKLGKSHRALRLQKSETVIPVSEIHTHTAPVMQLFILSNNLWHDGRTDCVSAQWGSRAFIPSPGFMQGDYGIAALPNPYENKMFIMKTHLISKIDIAFINYISLQNTRLILPVSPGSNLHSHTCCHSNHLPCLLPQLRPTCLQISTCLHSSFSILAVSFLSIFEVFLPNTSPALFITVLSFL